MRHRRVTLVVVGLRTYLGREVCRFGRALGHRMVAVVDGQPPELTEPWMHGIHWMTDTDPLTASWPDDPLAAILYCDTTLWEGDLWEGGRRSFEEVLLKRPQQLMEAAAEHTPPLRFVLRSTVRQPFLPSRFTAFCREAERRLVDTDLPSSIFRLPLLYGPDRPDSVAAMAISRILSRLPLLGGRAPRTMRVETAALAMLRAALEPDICGVFKPDDIARLGDVMIAQ